MHAFKNWCDRESEKILTFGGDLNQAQAHFEMGWVLAHVECKCAMCNANAEFRALTESDSASMQ
jgi:hypothetical protein